MHPRRHGPMTGRLGVRHCPVKRWEMASMNSPTAGPLPLHRRKTGHLDAKVLHNPPNAAGPPPPLRPSPAML